MSARVSLWVAAAYTLTGGPLVLVSTIFLVATILIVGYTVIFVIEHPDCGLPPIAPTGHPAP